MNLKHKGEAQFPVPFKKISWCFGYLSGKNTPWENKTLIKHDNQQTFFVHVILSLLESTYVSGSERVELPP